MSVRGYSVSEYRGLMPALKPQDPAVTFRELPDLGKVNPYHVVLLPGAPIYFPPVPDLRDHQNHIYAFKQRLGQDVPHCAPDGLRALRAMSRILAYKHNPSPEHIIPDHKTYLEGCMQFTVKQKEQLWKQWDTLFSKYGYSFLKQKRFMRRKAFLKGEPYPELKAPRNILCSDSMQIVGKGPFQKVVDHSWEECEASVKGLPASEVWDYINHRFEGHGLYGFLCTDFSQFERTVENDKYESVILQWHARALKNTAFKDQYLDIMHSYACRPLRISSKHLVAKVQSRASGDLDTSTGNGILNYVVCMQVFEDLGIHRPRSVHEGDDGLVALDGLGRCRDITELLRAIEARFRYYGFNIKAEHHYTLGECGFCQKFGDPTNSTILADPTLKLGKLHLSFSELARAPKNNAGLLLAKATSLRVEHQACPIVTAYANMLIRILSPVARPIYDRRDWYHDMLTRGTFKDEHISSYARHFVSEHWGYTIDEQLNFERWCEAQEQLCPLRFTAFERNVETKFPHWCRFALDRL